MSEVAAAIIVAGGTGSRFGRTGGKQLAPLLGRPVVMWTLEAVSATPGIGSIVVVCHPDAVNEVRDLVSVAACGDGRVIVTAGGESRRQSAAAGLAEVAEHVDAVLVHDGARPLADPQLFEEALRTYRASGADGVVVGFRSVDTMKVVAGDRVVETPDRSTLWAVQTPQVFGVRMLRDAHEAAARDGFEGTDDASLVERQGGTVLVFEGPRDNIKITTPNDLVFAEAVLARRSQGRA